MSNSRFRNTGQGGLHPLDKIQKRYLNNAIYIFFSRAKFLTVFVWFSSFSWIYYILTVPNFTTSIYAEDGSVYLQDIFEKGAVNTLFKTYAGYADIPVRTLAAYLSTAQPENYPLISSFLVALCIGLCSTIVYRYSDLVVSDKFLRSLLSHFLILIPIGRFESAGNLTNLHFFFFTASSVVCIFWLFGGQVKSSGLLFIFFSALSTPLCIFLFVFALAYYLLELRTNLKVEWYKSFKVVRLRQNPFIALLLGLIGLAMLSLGDLGSRLPSKVNSFEKTMYLFLDRQVGSTFLPFWGHVSSENGKVVVDHSPFNSLEIRLTLSLLVTFCFLLLFTWLSKEYRIKFITIGLPVIFYTGVIGYLYNLEPRYTIFPSFLTMFLFIVAIDYFLRKQTKRQNTMRILVLIIFIGISLNSRSESTSRLGGISWENQVSQERKECMRKSTEGFAEFQLAPFRNDTNWILTVPCAKLER